VRGAELERPVAAGPDRLDEPPVLVELHDARVAVAVGHEDVPLRVPANIGLPMERIRPVCPGVLTAARCLRELVERVGPLPEHHEQLAVWTEFLDDVGAFIDGPDVVVLVHAHGMRECEAVAADAELLDERAGLVEFEQARLAAAREDEDVAL